MSIVAKGIDVSTFQGTIDWEKVKADGVKFAIIRGGYGRHGIDERFEQNYKNAKKAGVPVGVYHYSYATTVANAKEEAALVLSYLKGKQFEYPVVFDIEDETQRSLSKSLLTDITKAFCESVEKAGYYVCIYSSKDFLTSKLDMKKLSQYDVWVAQWNKTCTYKGDYGLWQYSDKGKVNGISGNVDLDYAYKDYPSIIKNAGLNNLRRPTKPAEVKYTKGQKIILKDKILYASSTEKSSKTKKSGVYYIYDGKKVNGRYRITVKKSFCGKQPVFLFVTGWVEL